MNSDRRSFNEGPPSKIYRDFDGIPVSQSDGPGWSSKTNEELDRAVLALDRQASSKGFRYRRFSQMDGTVAKRHIIKGVFARGETSAWIAPPGGMKSALLAQASICVASGADWHGKRNKEQCAVVYFALERADLVSRRLQAHKLRMNLPDLPIALVSDTFDLMNPATVAKVVATIKDVEADFGLPVGLGVFDTFAKLIAAGGGDEDKAKDQGKVFANLQRVKHATDVHVALVGHTGKDITRGARGSNAILGDADIMVEISGTEIRTATVTKANDGPEGVLFSFTSEIHEFGLDEDGDPITVNIVGEETVSQSERKSSDRWTRGLRLVRDCIEAALIDGGTEHQIPNGPTVRVVLIQAARAVHKTKFVSNGDGDRYEAERKAWGRNFKAARDNGLIGGEISKGGQLIWIIS